MKIDLELTRSLCSLNFSRGVSTPPSDLDDDDMEVFFTVVKYIHIFVFYSFSNLLWPTPSSAAFDVCINYDASDLLGLRPPSPRRVCHFVLRIYILFSHPLQHSDEQEQHYLFTTAYTARHNMSSSLRRVTTVRGDDKNRFKKKIRISY